MHLINTQEREISKYWSVLILLTEAGGKRVESTGPWVLEELYITTKPSHAQ